MRKVGVSAVIAVALLGGSSGARAQEQEQQVQQTGDDATVLKGEPGGFTSDAVAKRAALTSYQAQASTEALRGAAARVDAAWAAFLPRLSTVASYTRLSDLTPPSLGTLVGASQPGPVTSLTDGNGNPTLIGVNTAFPIVLNNYLLQATLTVPVSDYFLRIDQNYTAATHARDAARFDLDAARTKSASDGKIAFYNFIRAKGSLIVAKLALQDQQTHLTDTKNLAQVGNATRVDVLRGETAVAASELAVVQTQNFVDLAAKQLRIAIHVADSVPVASAETLDGNPLPPVQGTLSTLISEGQSQRFEIRSIDANAAAERQLAKVARAGAYPSVSAFGDAILANPNQRIFPQSDSWTPTWDLGVRLTWSPNDIPTALANAADFNSRAAELIAQQQQLRDGISIEVTQAYQAVQEADFSLGSTAKQLSSAREAVRVARELFKAGRVNSTTLTDAETDLTRARLSLLNARIDARTARVRLDHALGRDNAMASVSP